MAQKNAPDMPMKQTLKECLAINNQLRNEQMEVSTLGIYLSSKFTR